MTTRVQPERPKTATGGEMFAHIVTKADQMRGYIEGVEVTALCGYRWVPSRDPENLPRCSPCLLEYENAFGSSWG